MNREIEKLRKREAETKWAKADGERKNDRKRREDIAQCSLITRAAEVQEADMSNPVDTRGRAMGSHDTQGEDVQQAPTGDWCGSQQSTIQQKKGTVCGQA